MRNKRISPDGIVLFCGKTPAELRILEPDGTWHLRLLSAHVECCDICHFGAAHMYLKNLRGDNWRRAQQTNSTAFGVRDRVSSTIPPLPRKFRRRDLALKYLSDKNIELLQNGIDDPAVLVIAYGRRSQFLVLHRSDALARRLPYSGRQSDLQNNIPIVS